MRPQTGALPFGSRLTVLFIAAVGCLPIVGQPVQVDDPLFLGIAKQILETPTDPFGGKPTWHDGDWYSENANPPLWSYLLAATAAVFGWNESAFQLLQCIANFALTFGVFALARRVCLKPLFWTTAVMLSPFLLSGRNLMADTLLLALWCWSFELFLQDALDGKRGRAIGAGLLAAAAMLAKYTGGLLPLIFLVLMVRWRTWRPSAIVIPAAAFALWCGHNQLHYGRMHFFANVGGGGFDLVDRLRVFTRVVGAMLLWGPVWIVAAWSTVGGIRRAILVFAIPVAAGLAWADLHDAIIRMQLANVIAAGALVAHFGVFMAFGVLAFAAFTAIPFATGERTPQGQARFALLVWLATAATFNVFATSAVAFGAVRHLILVVIPVMSLASGAFDRLSHGRWAVQAFAWLTLSACAGLGGLLAHGDRLAGTAGVRVAELAGQYASRGNDVWIVGDPALRYHAERSGAKRWRGDAAEIPVGGYVIALFSRSLAYRHHALFTSQSRMVQRVRLESWNRFRTQDAQVSFYGANAMTLPWMIDARPVPSGPGGRLEYDEIYVYQRMK
jgi:4-amino-4-deoxy-L-arabinose transferase-like glycosyltransferase